MTPNKDGAPDKHPCKSPTFIVEFCKEHCFIAAFVFVTLADTLIKAVRSAWIRFLRMLMVRKHGWPPPHLDADGDPAGEAGNNEPGNGDVFYKFDGPVKAVSSDDPKDVWEETIDCQKGKLMEGIHMRADLVISPRGQKALDEPNELLNFVTDEVTLDTFCVELKV